MPFTGSIASGVSVADSCKKAYNEMKTHKRFAYLILRLSDDFKEVVIDKVGRVGETYHQFVEELLAIGQKGQGRYAVYDAHYCDNKTSKLVLFTWLNDDTVGVKQKMLYSSTLKTIREELPGIAKDVQCNDQEDLAWSRIVDLCSSKYD